MRWSAVALLVLSSVLHAQEMNPALSYPDTTNILQTSPVLDPGVFSGTQTSTTGRGFLESDKEFSSFIGPISSPILSKDPRSLTELRGLFISDWIPQANAFARGGDFQVYALQARVALTDRLTFIADKDGIASLHTRTLPSQTGFLNTSAGLKYTLLRDVESQTLGAVGFMYEMPSGEAKVFQNHGAGVWTLFGVFGQEFAGDWHFLFNKAVQFGQNARDNTTFIFGQVHIDKGIGGWLYPLAELNWYHYVSSGNRGIPAIVGEGDGLINFGTSGMRGQTLVSAALGLKAKVSTSWEIGAAWETPVSTRKDFLGQRVIAELIFRY